MGQQTLPSSVEQHAPLSQQASSLWQQLPLPLWSKQHVPCSQQALPQQTPELFEQHWPLPQQVDPPGQAPQAPSQPLLPQVLPEQSGVQSQMPS